MKNKEQSGEQSQRFGDSPRKNPETKYPVKPKDSASLIVLKNNKGKLQVLMGRRGRKAVFSNVYVFAGIPKGFGSSIPSPIGTPPYNDIENIAEKKPNTIHELSSAGNNK